MKQKDEDQQLLPLQSLKSFSYIGSNSEIQILLSYIGKNRLKIIHLFWVHQCYFRRL